MKVDMRMLLETCIEHGLERGWRQAHKHTDTPSSGHVTTCQNDAIWLEIDTYFKFNDTDSNQNL
jgi:hypothetical protein